MYLQMYSPRQTRRKYRKYPQRGFGLKFLHFVGRHADNPGDFDFLVVSCIEYIHVLSEGALVDSDIRKLAIIM